VFFLGSLCTMKWQFIIIFPFYISVVGTVWCNKN